MVHKGAETCSAETRGIGALELLVAVGVLALACCGLWCGLALVNSREGPDPSSPLLELRAAIKTYHADLGALPGELESLVHSGDRGRWFGPYLEAGIPADHWGRPIQYSATGSTSFQLISPGLDGVLSTEDDIVVKGSVESPSK